MLRLVLAILTSQCLYYMKIKVFLVIFIFLHVVCVMRAAFFLRNRPNKGCLKCIA